MSGAQIRVIETRLKKELIPAFDQAVHMAIDAAIRRGNPPATRQAAKARTQYVLNARKRTPPKAARDKQVLAFLKRHPRVTPKELAQGLGVGRNVIAGAIWRLQQGGWVRRTALL